MEYLKSVKLNDQQTELSGNKKTALGGFFNICCLSLFSDNIAFNINFVPFFIRFGV